MTEVERNWEYTEERTGHSFCRCDAASAECSKCGEVFTYNECKRGSIGSCEDYNG